MLVCSLLNGILLKIPSEELTMTTRVILEFWFFWCLERIGVNETAKTARQAKVVNCGHQMSSDVIIKLLRVITSSSKG